ncbi:bifunctional homocysteine S-methyltransferase/methylenetetrahydrofolate reductase [Desulfomicrobium escambiense]|uniref:bifunctional homocysteine S-methyltransferase/methylenetetrahydrofolate reductase n=1 Tax=Desulfomicrobium escambiense TaxID=29503 RepID=UPI00040BF4F3|nr:bifunctional homocysteine S-methyltransferase/methylenetetrahydrofolate reductase [Desulfomicrobium escambiense]
MRRGILDVLRERVVVADGAMGSLLFERGVDSSSCYDALNLTDPALVRSIHQAYAAAGAEVLETNTFGANRAKLGRFDLGHRVREINLRGAELAQAEAGEDRWVAGAMGPLGRLGEETAAPGETEEIFAEQARALVEGGVDFIMLETFASLTLLLSALRGVKGAVSVPVAAQMVFTQRGRTHSGRSARECFEALVAAGADIVGLNCGIGPKNSLEVVRALGPVPVPLSVLPNAGFPEAAGDRLMYASSPEYFARQTAACAVHGARLLGGCCGTGPEHIAALVKALGSALPEVRIEAPSAEERTAGTAVPTRLARRLQEGKVVLVELDPPKHLDTEPVLRAAEALAAAGVDAITIAENPLAVPRLSNITLAGMVRARTGADVVVHLTGRDRNLVGMQSTIMGLAASNLHNVLAVTGDPPSAGSAERVSGVYDLRSMELISLLAGFNRGRNHYGDDMRLPVNFCIGAAFNPNTRNMALQVGRMEKKIAAGATHFLTQPVYSRSRVDEILAATAHVKAPIVLGIMPLASHRNAEFLHNEFPGIEIPLEARERMARAGDAGQREGIEIAWELLEYAWPHFAGVYIIPPFNRYQMALELMRRLGL